MQYDVTIGIPVYRTAAYVRRALESALRQDCPALEVLVVDDGSDDGSMDIVRHLQSGHPKGTAIRIVSHPANQGVSASRNDIIAAARGEYLYFLDSDDMMADGALSLLLQSARNYNAEVVFGSYQKIGLTGERQTFRYPSLQLLGTDQLACFAYRKYGGIQASACNCLVRTSLLRSAGLRFVEADYWEDLVFTADLVTLVSRAVLLPDITYFYYCREGSLSHYQAREQVQKDEILSNVRTVGHLRDALPALSDKAYFPNRCLFMVMTGFYMACNVLKRRHDIVPPVTDSEIKAMVSHPASLSRICTFRQSRLKNLAFCLVGLLPSSLCVSAVWCLGKMKKLI